MYEISIGCTDCEENATISAWIEASNHQTLQAGLSLLLCHVQLVCLQLHCAELSNGAGPLALLSLSLSVLLISGHYPRGLHVAAASWPGKTTRSPCPGYKIRQKKWQKKQDHVFWHNYRFHPKTIFNTWYHVNKWAKDLKQKKAGWFPESRTFHIEDHLRNLKNTMVSETTS